MKMMHARLRFIGSSSSTMAIMTKLLSSKRRISECIERKASSCD